MPDVFPAPRRAFAVPGRRPTDRGSDHAAVDRFVKSEQAGLVGQELPDGDSLFAVLGELGPVRANQLFVVEPAPRVSECECQCSQSLSGRIDQHHRVFIPGLVRLLISDAAPDIDDFLAAKIGTAGASQFPPSNEVVGKRLAYRLKPRTDVSLYGE
jgi:hypothetical protein